MDLVDILEDKANLSNAKRSKIQPSIPNHIIQSEFEAMLLGDSSEDEESETTKVAGLKSSESILSERCAINAKPKDRLESMDEIVLTVTWMNNRLGAAYYNITTSELFVMEDIYDDITNFNITKALYRQYQPRYIVTILGGFDGLFNCLKKLVMMETIDEDRSSTSYEHSVVQTVLVTLPKSENSYENCYHRVRYLKLDSEPKDAENYDRLTFLNALLNFKCQSMIYALGLLLKYIDKHWGKITLDPSGKASFVSLNYITLRDLVMIDDDTYKALNIVQTRHHPSFFKFGNQNNKSQCGSLYALLNCCQSIPGMQFLWKTLRQPTRNIHTLNQRYDVIQFFLDPANQSIAETLTACLKQIYRLTNTILSRYLGPRAKASDWQRLYKTISNVIYIADVCENYRDKTELFEKIVKSITNEMHYVKYFIELIVDFEASKRENTFAVKADVDPELDELRNLKHALPQLLTRMGEKDLQENLPISVARCNMVYLPNIGYVLAIKQWDCTPPENDDISGLEFKFMIDSIRYYKSPSARELDHTVGDIMTRIAKRQSEIMLKLVSYINKHAKPILESIRLCAELDTLLSFYTVARNHNYVRPNVVESQVIAVKQGRHPLQEFSSTTYVPNDIYSGQGRSLIKILTGPNACGKSMYLKQVALIIFMAHIGCYVPAESATIGAMKHILTQIVTIDSIALDASAFLQSIRQINMTLYASTPDSLVIIDEFGKGTNETNGLCLLAAVLTNFLEKGPYCPHVLAATHIHRVIKLAPRSSLIEPLTFEFVTNEDESLAFLYHIVAGNASCSFAHSVARSSGLEERLVQRGLEVFEKIKEGKLPPRLPEVQHRDTVKYIIERVTLPDADFDLEELKSWIRQAIMPRARK